MTNETLTINSTDEELMEAYEAQRRMANGEAIGDEKQTPTEAVESERGWNIVRTIYGATNQPGTPVLATDPAGNLWVVNDLDGPWAILVAEAR